jgi:hypothetical protein
VVVVVQQVMKAVHKLEMEALEVRLLELQGLADSVAQLERMQLLLLEVPVELVVFLVSQEMQQVEELEVLLQTILELVAAVAASA